MNVPIYSTIRSGRRWQSSRGRLRRRGDRLGDGWALDGGAVAGKQAFRDNLVERFPREEKAIDRYLHMLEDVGRAMPMVTMGRFLKPWQRTPVKPLFDLLAPGHLYRTTWEVLSELTQDRDLIAVLCGQWGDLGLPPRRSAFLVHAQIRKSSGEAFTCARVGRIVVENGITRGVQMEDGTRIDCNCVVS